MKKRQLYDKKTGKNFVPISHTKAVLTPTGETAEARNTRQQQAVQGTGVSASANRYPFMSLGDVISIADVNRLLDMAYTSTDTKYQGRLRLRRSGQVAWVDQVLMNSLLGNWVQVLYGCYAPSSTGNSVVVDGKYHILWRQRTGTTSTPWRDLTSQMTLKTVNGKSLVGSGNIEISTDGEIEVDQEFDGDSENAIANKVVAEAVGELQSQVDGKASWKSGITLIDVWSETIDETTDVLPEGAFWWAEGLLYKKINGEWVDITDDEEYEDTFFVRQSDNTLYWYTGGGDMEQLFGSAFRTLEINTKTHFYSVGGVFKSNNLPGSSWHIVEGTYTGTGGIVWIDTYGTPRPLLGVWENQQFNLYTNWNYDETRFMPSDYHFTDNDFYIYRNTVSGNVGIIIGYYTGSYWQTSEYDEQNSVPYIYDVAYNEDDTDEHGDFPDGDAYHKYAMYGPVIYRWNTTNNEWEHISGTDEWYPVMAKCKNKLLRVWSDEDPEVMLDLSPDDELDETSKNAVENRIVAARINEHSERLDAIETALPSVRGCKVLPIDGVMPAGYTYIIEEVGYAGEGGELLLDVTNQRVVLALTEDGGEEIATIYFAVWNDAGGRLPNDVYDLTDPTNILFAWEGEGALHFGKLSGETLVEIAAGSAPTINIDTALSRTSANPVQNAAVYNAVNTLTTSLNSQNTRLTNLENSTTKFVQTIRVYGDDYQVYEQWDKGDLWYDDAEGELYICTSSIGDGGDTFELIEPKFGVLYYLSQTNKWCVWTGGGFDELQREELVISSSTL